jgi:hypothetical protein
MVTPTPAELLGLPLGPNDAGAATLREYLVKLLTQVWEDEEGFDGKRPFGNSSWQSSDVYPALKAAGLIEDEYGDRVTAAELVLSAIKALGEPGIAITLDPAASRVITGGLPDPGVS